MAMRECKVKCVKSGIYTERQSRHTIPTLKPMNIRKELLDELLQECKTPPDLFGEGGIIKQLTTALVERALEAELSTHLGYKKHESRPEGQNNSRNGYSQKKVQGDFGVAEIAVPRDRKGEFEPQMVKKGQSRLSGLDEKIIALYARGMSVRDIQGQLQEMYGVEVSPTLISNVTDEVIDEVKQWQNRPLDTVYPIVFLDCLVIKVRDNGRVINKSLYFALAVNMDGYKELLGMWISPNEGAKFWLSVLTEIHNRGVKDILIACVDGLTGFPNAIETVFPKTQVQLCIVHMVRNSVAFVPWQQQFDKLTDHVSKFVLTSRRFMRRQRNRRRNLTLNSLLKNGTSNIHRSPSLGAVIGRTLSPSLLSRPRFVGRFIPPMRLSR